MASPGSSLPSSAVLRKLLCQARDGGSIDQIMASLLGDQGESDFELLSDGSGSMTDASKRRLTSPPEKLETEVVLSGSEADKMKPGKSPASFGLKLPAGIKDMHHWGKTLLEVGKYGKEGFSYLELQSSTKMEHQSYCTWLLSQRHRVDLTPQVKDLIRYLFVKSEYSRVDGDCFEDSTVRRSMKA